MMNFRKVLNSVRAVLLITALLVVGQSNVLSQDHRWRSISTIPNTTDASALMFANDSFGLLMRYYNFTTSIGTPCLLTEDGGASWSKRGLDTVSAFYWRHSTRTYLDTTGYAVAFPTVGGPGVVFSTDSGLTWTWASAAGSAHWMLGNYFVSPSTFYIVWTGDRYGDKVVCQVTRDSGKNFEFLQDAYFLNVGEYAMSGCMYDSATAWVYIASDNEDGSFLMHTTTSGTTWDKNYGLQKLHLSMLTARNLDAEEYYQFTYQGADRGTIFLTNLERKDYYRDTVKKRKISYVYGLVITTDEGKTWWCDTTFRTPTAQMINPRDSALWGVVVESSTVIHSTDYGRSWEYDSTSFNGEPISLMYWRDADNGYVVTYKDSTIRIYKYQTTSTVGEEEEFTEQLSSVRIYPNPATKTVTIASVEQPSPYRIYDVLGREVLHGMTLDRAPLTLDVSHVARGVYYLFVDSPRTGRAVMAGKILLAEE